MENPFLLKLQTLAALSGDEEHYVRQLCQGRASYAANADLVSRGEDPDVVWIILSGMACRYKLLADGGRQIVAFMVPGDICDMHIALFGAMDHGIATTAPTEAATIARDEVRKIARSWPGIAHGLLVANLLDLAVAREWLVNNGRRDAFARIAHLLWELYVRHAAVGMARNGRFKLPITQQILADATSLTNVHVNRTLTRLKDEGVIEWSRKTLRVVDVKALQRIAGFDSDYLHGYGSLKGPEGVNAS